MNFDLKLGKAASVLFLALAMAGCGGGGSTPTAMPEPEPEPVMPPADLTDTQMAAKAAADAAKEASDAAATAASDAATATMNIATEQTGETAVKAAKDAMTYAATAKAEADKAMAAYAAAAAATTGDAAEAAWRDAVAAQEAAEAAAMMAADKAMMAKEAAEMELKIVGTMKSVGDTTLDAGAPMTVVTSGSGDTEQVVQTGLIGMLMATGPATDGQMEVDENPTTAAVEYKAPMVNAAARNDLEIGKEVDSADDMARLRIITAYASTQTVKVFAATDGTAHMSNKKGEIEVAAAGTGITDAANLGADDNVTLTLRPFGMFYNAAGGTAGEIEPQGPTTADPPEQQGDTVGADAKAQQIYTFVNTAVDPNVTVYVVLSETTATTDSEGETTTVYEYEIVDIYHPVNQDGLGVTGAAGDENVFVTAALPSAKSYSHVHFGVWAGLGEAAKDGSQEIADLGIGFVQSIGDGPTGADMPNHGSADYTGNWVAAIQRAHTGGDGTIHLMNGDASVGANFADGEITATLANLATLKGDITGNTFSGSSASGVSRMHGLDADATFTGTFSGGFYGESAEETAGVFDFSAGDNNEGGAFVGAFGGAREIADE